MPLLSFLNFFSKERLILQTLFLESFDGKIMNSENFDYKILLSVDKFDKNMWDILKYYEYIIHNILHIYIRSKDY